MADIWDKISSVSEIEENGDSDFKESSEVMVSDNAPTIRNTDIFNKIDSSGASIYESEKPKEEVLSKEWNKRQVSRTGARVGETALGIGGDLREVSKIFGGWVGGKLRSAIGKEPLTEEQKEKFEESMKPGTFDLVGQVLEALPTSKNLREGVTRKFTGDWLEPQNSWEEFSDNVASDVTSLMIPLGGRVPFARALGHSVIANAGGEVAKVFGGDKASAYTKMGLFFGLGLLPFGRTTLKNFTNGLYDDMRATVPQGAEVTATKMVNKLDRLEKRLNTGDPSAASKAPTFQKIQAIKNKVNDGMIDVDELLQLTTDTNEVIYGLGNLKRNQNSLYEVRDALKNTTKEYGSTNPQFMENWKSANQATAATELSRNVGNWVKSNVKAKDYIYAMAALGGEGALLGAAATAKTVLGAGAVAATAYGAEVVKRVAMSPALRKYYTNVVTHSLNQNKAGMVRAIKQLDDGLKKSFEDDPFDADNRDND